MPRGRPRKNAAGAAVAPPAAWRGRANNRPQVRDPKALLAALNAQVADCNTDKPEADQIAPFDEADEAGQAVEILEVTKRRYEMGEKTIDIDAFEGNNLVLVDEGSAGRQLLPHPHGQIAG